jgi:hypothetical protein
VNDAEVLYAVARRLFAESAEKFRRAHIYSLRTRDALTVDEQLKLFSAAIEQEKQALAMRAEAIENQIQASRIWRMHAVVSEANARGL